VEEGIMLQFLRLISGKITLEEALERIEEVGCVQFAHIKKHNAERIIEISFESGLTNTRMKTVIGAALRPHQFTMWKRPAVKTTPPPLRRRS